MSTRHLLLAIVAVGATMILPGCHAPSNSPAMPGAIPSAAETDWDAVAARAHVENKPIVLLVIDSGRGLTDHQIQSLFDTVAAGEASIVPQVLDLAVSRNRAIAAPFHAIEKPTLICLSPVGVVISRDDTAITNDLVRARIESAKASAPGLDTKFAQLQTAAAGHPTDALQQMSLTEFLLKQQNVKEAIPHLQAVAADESADLDLRVRAWVAMAKGHLWIIEPEKARHASKNLLAELGPKSAEAMAGGNLVLGIQDANAKRFTLARQEFEASIAAAPHSDYARESLEAIQKLPASTRE